MSSRSSEIPVDDHHRHENWQRVHDEGEEEVLGDKRQYERSRRKNLWYEEEEDDKWEQNADAQSDFFTGLCGQVEDENAEEWNEHRR